MLHLISGVMVLWKLRVATATCVLIYIWKHATSGISWWHFQYSYVIICAQRRAKETASTLSKPRDERGECGRLRSKLRLLFLRGKGVCPWPIRVSAVKRQSRGGKWRLVIQRCVISLTALEYMYTEKHGSAHENGLPGLWWLAGLELLSPDTADHHKVSLQR